MHAWRLHRDDGYTLTELLVVLAILALLVVVIAPQIVGGLGRARSDIARLRAERIALALTLYNADLGGYPTTAEGLRALLAPAGDVARWRGPYLKDAEDISDPWGTEFHYLAEGRTYALFSYGADGREGGTGEDADIRQSP